MAIIYFCISRTLLPRAADRPRNEVSSEAAHTYSHQSGGGTSNSSISSTNISKRSNMSDVSLASMTKNSRAWKKMQYFRRDLFNKLRNEKFQVTFVLVLSRYFVSFLFGRPRPLTIQNMYTNNAVVVVAIVNRHTCWVCLAGTLPTHSAGAAWLAGWLSGPYT